MEKIYLANYHLPMLMAITFISIGCTFNSDIKLPKLNLDKFFKN